MVKEVVILTLSEKWGKKCIAVYDVQNDCLLRLVSERTHGDGIPSFLTSNLECLDTVHINILDKCPFEHQIENVLIDLVYGFKKTNHIFKIEDIHSRLKTYPTIFGDNNYKINDASHVGHSLELIKFTDMIIDISTNSYGKTKTKVSFTYNKIKQINYSVTDSRFFGKQISIPSGYTVISLPPTDDFRTVKLNES